jgi:DNA-binding NarL/FixJ family response regulator
MESATCFGAAFGETIESDWCVILKTLERISIVENMFRPGVGLFVETILRSSTSPFIETVVVDAEDVLGHIDKFHPDVIILDYDSLLFSDAMSIAVEIRERDDNQLIIFISEMVNPVLVNEGMVAPLRTRAYWINQPSRNPAMILPEIARAFEGAQQVKSPVLKRAIEDATQFGLLSPQQHRVMRLLAMGGSNSAIAQECKLTVKAVERTIATASKLLEVEVASEDTNHRVKAAMRYVKLMLFADSAGLIFDKNR